MNRITVLLLISVLGINLVGCGKTDKQTPVNERSMSHFSQGDAPSASRDSLYLTCLLHARRSDDRNSENYKFYVVHQVYNKEVSQMAAVYIEEQAKAAGDRTFFSGGSIAAFRDSVARWQVYQLGLSSPIMFSTQDSIVENLEEYYLDEMRSHVINVPVSRDSSQSVLVGQTMEDDSFFESPIWSQVSGKFAFQFVLTGSLSGGPMYREKKSVAERLGAAAEACAHSAYGR